MIQVLKPLRRTVTPAKDAPPLTRARMALWQLMPKNPATGQGHCAPVFRDDGFAYFNNDHNNNCYSFAVNAPNWERRAFVTPGETGGTFARDPHKINAANLHQRLLADGLIPAPKGIILPPPGFFLIAAFCADGHDHHFLRRGADGKWYHKDSFNIPERIAFRKKMHDGLYHFTGYYWVPNCGLKLDYSEGQYIPPREVIQNQRQNGR